MIYLKNAQQLDCMRKSGAMLYEVLCRLREAIKPGMSTAELDVYAEQLIRKHKAIPSFLDYQGYPASICVSVNDEVVHGIPHKEHFLDEGDIVSLDAGVIYEGYHSELANVSINVKASIGIAFFPEHGDDSNKVVAAADEAMYFVKKNGKANYHIYQPEDSEMEDLQHTL